MLQGRGQLRAVVSQYSQQLEEGRADRGLGGAATLSNTWVMTRRM